MLGAGLGGVEQEFELFGECADARTRAAMLDESLEIIDRLMAGGPVVHCGQHYVVGGVSLAPLSVQQPRVPIWIGDHSDAALRRAARWAGWIPMACDQNGAMTLAPDQLAAKLVCIRQHRSDGAAFEIALTRQSEPQDRSLRQAHADAGATLWLEMLHGLRDSFEAMLQRAVAGPTV